MKHHFIDHYWDVSSPITKLDPRVKIVLSFAALILIVITPNGRFLDYILFTPPIAVVVYLSKLPVTFIFKRLFIILPLVIFIAASLPFVSPGKPLLTFHFFTDLKITDTGLLNFASVIIKASFAVLLMTILTSTTKFRDLVAGLQMLKCPVIFTSILGFMYRYIFLFIDEAEHLNIGRISRSFGRRPMLAMKGFGWMISSLFLRSFERGERIYHTMCARGFTGAYKTLTEMRIRPAEISFFVIAVIIMLTIKIAGHYYG